MVGLDRLFDPDAVAIIGATNREGSVGRTIIENLDRTFDGRIVPVNPKYAEVLGYPCADDITAAPPVDLAVVVLPAELVLETVEDLATAEVRNVVIISAGFGEAGGGGTKREQQLVALADRHGLQIIGPNSLGVLSTASGLNVTFGPLFPAAGPISMLSQSGAFITAVLDWAADQALGFRHVVSLGNEAVLDETDVLRAVAGDPETDVVMGYLEGIDDGRRFIETVREITTETPVVLVKSGRTAAGSCAASSHTGSIAGDDAAYETGLDQAGVIRVETVEELIDATRAFASLPTPPVDSVAVVTNAGGPGVLATDTIGASDLRLADFHDETIAEFESLLPPDASIYNPVDILGDADDERFGKVITAAIADDAVGAVLVVAAPTGVLSFDAFAQQVTAASAEAEKPVVVCAMGGRTPEAAIQVLEEHALPTYFDPARAVFGLEMLSRQRHIANRTYNAPRVFDVDGSNADAVLAEARDRDRTTIGLEGLALLEAYGIPTPPGGMARNPSDAERIVETFENSAAMKMVSPEVTHKSDIGGVKLDVSSGDIREAYERIVTNVQNYQTSATIVGVYVQEMVDLSAGTETIVGAVRDPQFGPMILFGLGGIFVETLEDTTTRIAPVTESEAREMVHGIEAAPVLRGARGRTPADIDAIVDVIERISQLMLDRPQILELDVNPLVAGPEQARAIDFRATIDTEDA